MKQKTPTILMSFLILLIGIIIGSSLTIYRFYSLVSQEVEADELDETNFNNKSSEIVTSETADETIHQTLNTYNFNDQYSITYKLFEDIQPLESWSTQLNYVELYSTLDSDRQPAYYYQSTENAPLIVSLHQWSQDFTRFDPISDIAINKNWNYIRPNFRGPNNNNKAGGSEYVISDIDDAILFAVQQGNVDTSQIYIIGASGGGHAGLMHLMNSEIPVSHYSIWVPITDLIAWYGESSVRNTRYGEDIWKITSSQEQLNIEEAKRRSPIYQETPVNKLSNTAIDLYAGIHDGYEGTVPISHSIRFYNKLVEDLGYGEEHSVPSTIESQLIYTRSLQMDVQEPDFLLDDRHIIYQNGVNQLSLTIFEGNHEILPHEAINRLKIISDF